MDRLVSLLFVRRGYDLLLLSNGLIGLCWLLQSPSRTLLADAYKPLASWLDPLLPGYYLRWIGGLVVLLALLGYWALSTGRQLLGVYTEIALAFVYFLLALSAFVGARKYQAGYSAGFIWISFGFAHIQAAVRNDPVLQDKIGDPDEPVERKRKK